VNQDFNRFKILYLTRLRYLPLFFTNLGEKQPIMAAKA
jgi:hypothetical protein